MTFQLYDYPGGKIYLDLDEGEYAQRMLNGNYEPEFTNRMVAYLKPGMTFVDVGAHVGYYSLWAAKLVGEKGCVYSFEPAYGLYPLLNEAAELNGYSWLIAIRGAAGFDNSPRRFIAHENSWGGRLSNANAPSVPTNVYCLDCTILSTPDVIKIDAEGMELDVLRGLRDKTFAFDAPLLLLIAIHPEYGVTYDMLREMLEPQGFVLEQQTNGNQVIAQR